MIIYRYGLCTAGFQSPYGGQFILSTALINQSFVYLFNMAQGVERLSVDGKASSVSLEETEETASNSLEVVASSNTLLNRSNVSEDLFSKVARSHNKSWLLLISHFDRTAS